MIPLGTGRFWVPRESWRYLESVKHTQEKEMGAKNPSARGLKTPLLDREREILYPLSARFSGCTTTEVVVGKD